MPDFEDRLQTHLVNRYEAETVHDLNRICHVGRVSCETMLDILISIEADHALKDHKALEDYDKVFQPNT